MRVSVSCLSLSEIFQNFLEKYKRCRFVLFERLHHPQKIFPKFFGQYKRCRFVLLEHLADQGDAPSAASALALWFEERIRRNGGRLKKTAIVALARKRLVAGRDRELARPSLTLRSAAVPVAREPDRRWPCAARAATHGWGTHQNENGPPT